MKYQTMREVPGDVLDGMIALLGKRFPPPTESLEDSVMQFRCGQCSVWQEMVEEKGRREREVMAGKGVKNG